ncbi:Transcription factor bHLH103 [Platanthera guangdongensis]|uniref:Transcription factor bHLH103 n=1 Tax=Platanthera guangdongensis TaxID=2320717 RepID=A0ABR2LWI8_9ASPA
MAEDFQPSNCRLNTTKHSDDHSDYTFSTSSTDWSHNLFSCNTEMAESSSFHAMLPEVYSTSSIYQPLMPNSSSPSSSYACSSAPVELSKCRQSILFNNQQMGGGSISNETSEIFKGSLLTQQPSINQQQFTNNVSFWNDASGFNPLFSKNSGEQREKSSCLKRPQIAPPSTRPAFKMKKEKLGDRIAALQQLVSPFGKTDRASVLHEAIEYIKFLHDQLNVLISPYLKAGHSKQQDKKAGKLNDAEESVQELRSRGLCLVPVASTYSVNSLDHVSSFADILSARNFGRAFM